MDRSPHSSRKRREETAHHGKPPIRLSHSRKPSSGSAKPPATQSRHAKTSSETRVLREADQQSASARSSVESDPNARHFTVTSVGKGGTLYLQPRYMSTRTPTTPPQTRDGSEVKQPTVEIQGNGTKPQPRARTSYHLRVPHNGSVPIPAAALGNTYAPPRRRSHSYSIVGDPELSRTRDVAEFQGLRSGRRNASRRPKSSIDIPRGLLDLKIPHYRIGTPRFGDRGTAYLHESIYAPSTSEELRYSMFSRNEIDKLFPPREQDGQPTSRTPSWTRSREPPANAMTPDISPALFDLIEAYSDDQSIVQYSRTTGHILAATPARLIAQITSPVFLDYDLLADFFLTYRSFLSRGTLLQYLLCRLQWSLESVMDAGRIVRVRTFVALRHWILNYFPDDWVPDEQLRQTFCNGLNSMVKSLRKRSTGRTTDINLIGELKKCWRRTSLTVWPVTNVAQQGPDDDIVPGGDAPPPQDTSFVTDLPPGVLPPRSRMDFRRTSVFKLPLLPATNATDGKPALKRLRTVSIPTSPMSEVSVEVLSCSVPFLNNLRSIITQNRKRSLPSAQLFPPTSLKNQKRSHKRGGSFSDALRDDRPSLPSVQMDSVNASLFESMTLTGGLVRGLLLQPSPPMVESSAPLALSDGDKNAALSSPDAFVGFERQSNVKRKVGDAYRALSGRKGSHEQVDIGGGRTSRSSNLRDSGPLPRKERNTADILPRGQETHRRVDTLGERIEHSYKDVFEDSELSNGIIIHASPSIGAAKNSARVSDQLLALPEPDYNRMHSHVTTSSRSIVIVDDTNPPEGNPLNGVPSLADSWSYLSGLGPFSRQGDRTGAVASSQPGHVDTGPRTTAPSNTTHQLLAAPVFCEDDADSATLGPPQDRINARKSSSAHPPGLDMPPIRHQLRRRPGGDLRAAVHVHDLLPDPRPSSDSFSLFLHSRNVSRDESLQDSNRSPPVLLAQQALETHETPPTKRGSWSLLQTHSSQPNMTPSFQAQVSHLANLPDKPSDGGIEDALARLEGKATPISATRTDHRLESALSKASHRSHRRGQLHLGNVSVSVAGSSPTDATMRSPQTGTHVPSTYRTSASETTSYLRLAKGGQPESPYRSTANSPAFTSPSQFRFPSGVMGSERMSRSPRLRVRPTDVAPTKPGTENLQSPNKAVMSEDSFLLNDNESLSDISTDIEGDQSDDEDFGVRSFFFDDTVEHEQRSLALFQALPTPPPSAGPPSDQSPQNMRSVSSRNTDGQHALKEANSAPRLFSPADPSDPRPTPGTLRRANTSSGNHQQAHLPFILAFPSDTIAEQLTIIEKDALDGVKWNDLVALNWQQIPPKVFNWVDFLKSDNANGIDIVIARFNLMVRWVVSECVLTESPVERARCISKYIRIAEQTHRLRNYASTYQITLALLSTDIARLQRTWALVSAADKQTLNELRILCQPLRNFQRLRTDMDANATDSACIPFIGLYTHDLVFNAQKPARIEPPPPAREPLVNFERFQTAAGIIKSLLRLIEASSRYVFRPHPEVLSRCLWLAALDEPETAMRSKALEP